MNISAKTEYACVAMIELAALYESGEPVRVRELAATHGIPNHFLTQILLQLKGAGMVQSTRGSTGGYRLSRDPSEISIYDIHRVIEGDSDQPCGALQKPTPAAAVLKSLCCEAAAAQREILSAATLADMAEKAGSTVEDMFYI
ncbi:RrF2 family transcriptional regulator [Blastopirellula marina]|uniref:Transcriptional regulator n=1 Tax=Blastopirellula marina TaxID=124 RepID=A0A2S8G7R1_9BACT|nr:Rrf2 family transcriptional regulator [Blastopirellula marina]PQO40174.1 transcriptional regulator [Blastopirellula marina]PQO43554.1 transcriptional regulator [Blastopirellula marina]PTL45541.1 Rrf2 family transcriptional regulator [Blastopirellula marina]